MYAGSGYAGDFAGNPLGFIAWHGLEWTSGGETAIRIYFGGDADLPAGTTYILYRNGSIYARGVTSPYVVNAVTAHVVPDLALVAIAPGLDSETTYDPLGGEDAINLTEFRARVARIAALGQRLDAYAKSGYRVYAIDLADNSETYLGFVAAGSAPTLTGVSLADGHYKIRLEGDGYFWRGVRYARQFMVTIEGGVVVFPLPVVAGLGSRYGKTDTQLYWHWALVQDSTPPDDFAIWTSLTEPVDTSGAPTYTTPANSPGPMSLSIAQGAAILYVAICARRGSTKGPFTLLTIPAPPTTLNSPANQSAHF